MGKSKVKTVKKGPRRGEGTPSGGPIRSLKRPMNPKKLTPAVLKRLVQAVANRENLRNVCKELNIAYNTFVNWLKEPNPIGLVLDLQVALKQTSLSQWQEAKPKLELSAEQQATETRVIETVERTRLIGFPKEITATLMEIGGEELVEEFAQCATVILEKKTIKTVLPDGGLALRILKEQERRDEKEAEAIQKAAGPDGTGQIPIITKTSNAPDV